MGLFQDECKVVLQSLRGALTEALTSLGLDASRPQQLAQRLGLHRKLCLKLAKIVTSADAFAAVPHVPGSAGVELLLTALAKAGVAPGIVQRIRVAREDFDGLLQRHAGDRITLDTVAGGFVPQAQRSEGLLQARREAFRGNSAILGVQARVLMAVSIMAPSAEDPRRVDLGLLNGILDLRRLRPDVAWPLFRRKLWSADGVASEFKGRPLEPQSDAGGAPLLRAFCSPDLPEMDVRRSDDEVLYELPAGPVGRTAELTYVYGSYMPSVGTQYVDGDETLCEIGCNLETPVEVMHMDMLVHESLTWAMRPRGDAFSLLGGRPVRGHRRHASTRLMLERGVHELGRGLDTMATPHMPNYGAMLAYAFSCLGWDPSDFRGFRFTLPHPPIPALALMSMDLAQPPQG
ncbi:MAG: hypothetical protein DRQ55_12055 [Planctomycetota bacterium]|nr:MAG: hypothetical protein DRQ55_12055 [Planctomycetota bacterium]